MTMDAPTNYTPAARELGQKLCARGELGHLRVGSLIRMRLEDLTLGSGTP
jgi:hypothetical protein